MGVPVVEKRRVSCRRTRIGSESVSARLAPDRSVSGAQIQTSLESSILDDDGDAAQLGPLLADTEIVVGHIWRAAFPPAPRLRLLQSVAAGLDLLDTGAVPKGVTI